jgi:hypothetical protein
VHTYSVYNERGGFVESSFHESNVNGLRD